MIKKVEVFPNGSMVFIEGNITARLGKQKPDVVVMLEELDGVSEAEFRQALNQRKQFPALRKSIEDKVKALATQKRDDKLKGLQSQPTLDIIRVREQPPTNLEKAVATSE